ncbi:putative ATPase [Luteibacter sp. 1214]|uniref:AAA family ATPase n=1 Tax=Luteibacter sp. 1214 TaxID=2817735 RepID=UPI00285FFBDF|nr:AAA family ATPase [Luteibacter sp. 1214]MDR6642748.1 putative ATPase [Luteibacter sp. 1214]
MKLKALRARGVHGYLHFDIKFNDSLSFLVGPNGCGKSSALRLIEALITPSLQDIISTSLEGATLEFEHSGDKRIDVYRSGESLSISASWVDARFHIPNVSQIRDFSADDPRSAADYLTTFALDSGEGGAVLKAIADIPAPVFLGIDRQLRTRPDIDSSTMDDLTTRGVRDYSVQHRYTRGQIIDGLRESHLLIRDAYRDARRKLDSAQEQLRTEVLLSIFEYIDAGIAESSIATFGEADALRVSADAISKALIDIGLPSRRVEEKRQEFTDNVQDLFGRMAADSKNPPVIEFLMNRATLSRMKNVIDVVQDFNDRSKRIFGRLDQFQESLNWFFADSRKKIAIDQVGRIGIARPDSKPVALPKLSSGEKQIIVMFSHIFFNKYGSRSRIIVIDEPELSLHVRWQENLVEKVRAASPNTQLIFATHSPDIVGANDDNCVEINP